MRMQVFYQGWESSNSASFDAAYELSPPGLAGVVGYTAGIATFAVLSRLSGQGLIL